ncbi:glycosyltransferase family 25 protein (plasmid) [Bartonella sp. HY329]|uniref:glycosyltransferase family 25 protein n=1 Tax=unclassified Bartonella TaxID=2645622 RepID=UPI0021C6AB7E|nr:MULTISPECIES: glycosyltransferase family 25 protein [unclassified Bartonella]UXM96506.1 glycosyltransferase family 25 protein [Bartonella sp. HY329]UXN10829.1 glycosyltransferase family 25 protein [Bartonella sp. HY328]
MKLFVINLDRSLDRLNHVNQQFSDLGLTLTRIAGVDGTQLSDEDYQHITSVRHWPLELTKREVGCFLSHRNCLKLIAEGKDAFGAIFEDDVILSKNSAAFLENWDWIPSNTDIVKLDTAETPCVIGRTTKKISKDYILAPLVTKHYCAGGYIVSRDCAKKLYALTEFAFAPIDEIYFNPECGVMAMFNIEQFDPAIVIQAGLVSTIRNIASEEANQDVVRKAKKRSFPQKMAREFSRFKKRYLYPLWLVLTRGYQWKTIKFK